MISEESKKVATKLYDVILYSSESDPSEEYVTGCLMKIFKFPPILSAKLMWESKTKGKTLVYTTPDRSEATIFRNKILACNIKSEICPYDV